MATRELNLTNEWQELSETACIIQGLEIRSQYLVTYSDGVPEVSGPTHIVRHTDMLTMPAPITGSLYVKGNVLSGSIQKIAVTDI